MPKKTASQIGRSSRQKGQRGERWLVAQIKHVYDRAARGIQTREGGAEASDVEGTPFHWEMKRTKGAPQYTAALRQAESDTDGRPAVCVFKQDGKDATVMMKFTTMLWLIENFMSVPQVEAYLERKQENE